MLAGNSQPLGATGHGAVCQSERGEFRGGHVSRRGAEDGGERYSGAVPI